MSETATAGDALGALDNLVEGFTDDARENAKAWSAWAMTNPIPALVACGHDYHVRHLLTRACDVPGVKGSAERFRRDFAEAVIEKRRRDAEQEFADGWGAEPDEIEGLQYDGNGKIKPNVSNAILAFTKHARWTGKIRWNDLAQRIEVDGRTLTDTGITLAQRWAIDEVGVDFGPDRVFAALDVVAREHPYHPVRDYLSGLTWDGKERLHRLLSAYFGAEETQYTATIGSRFLIGAVARAMQPGCKHRSVLVLVGDQNIGKSEGIRLLCGADWFSDAHIDPESKDAYLALQGRWMVELAECDRLLSWRHAAIVKSFVSQVDDTFRPPYGRCTVTIPRCAVFVGTTNEAEFLTDPTGSTRFWPVTIRRAEFDAIRRDRDQLWAEAAELYRAGHRWHLDADEEAERRKVAAAHEVEDPRDASVLRWITGRAGFTTEDVLAGALEVRGVKANSGEGRAVGQILRRAGWSKSTDRAGAPDRQPRWYRD